MTESTKHKFRELLALFNDYLRMGPMLLAMLVFSAWIGFYYPEQFGLLIYAAARMSFGAFLGYWVDRMAFGGARVDDFAIGTQDYWRASWRRAAIVSASMVAGGLVT